MSPPGTTLLETITPFSAPSKTKLDTSEWFDGTYASAPQSPIDEFRGNLVQINKLYLQADGRGEYNSMLGSLVYLGMQGQSRSAF